MIGERKNQGTEDWRMVDLEDDGLEDGGSKGGEVKVDFIDSKESGTKSSKRRGLLKWMRSDFKRLFPCCFP